MRRVACVAGVERGRGWGNREGVGERGKGIFPFPSFVLFSLPLSLPFLRLPGRLARDVLIIFKLIKFKLVYFDLQIPVNQEKR